jgi:glycosyltransferase involved in cell wall biosynthesis
MSSTSPRRRILVVHDYGTRSGGAEHIALGLRDGLRRRGHDALLFTSGARPLPLPVLADETCFGTMSPARRVLQAVNPWALRRLRQVVADYQPDVVHLRMFMTQLSPLVLQALRGVPTLLHLVNYDLICPLNTKVLPDGSRCTHTAGFVCRSQGCIPLAGVARFGVQRALWRRGRPAADLVVANSHWLARRLAADGVETDSVIWNGVPERPARPPLAGEPTVSFAGRMFSKKGVDVLLRAMARIPGGRLVIAGDGPERRSLERLASELGLSSRAVFLGHLTHEALEEELASAWVHAVPSVWEEPFGITAAEALMRGTAVVASAAGGVSELVDEGRTGLLAPPGDDEALAKSLARILDDRELAERFGAEGRRFALAELTDERFLDRVEALYESLLATEVSVQESPAPA